MNDNQIKAILSNDKSYPEKPVNEWRSIQRKIEAQKNKFSFNFFLAPASLAVVCFLVWFLWSPVKSTGHLNEELLAQDLNEISNYLNETDEFYSWID